MRINLNKLESLINNKNYTKQEICKICQINQDDFPNSLYNMKVDKFVTLCKLLDATPSDLLN